MDLNELKFLLRNSASVVIMEEGHPSLVIVDYQVYKNMIQGGSADPTQRVTAAAPFTPDEQEAIERLNQEIAALKEQIAMEEPQTEQE